MRTVVFLELTICRRPILFEHNCSLPIRAVDDFRALFCATYKCLKIVSAEYANAGGELITIGNTKNLYIFSFLLILNYNSRF